MNQSPSISRLSFLNAITVQYSHLLRCFFAGLLVPCGFAPFHLPGLMILGLALFFAQLQNQETKQSFLCGFVFGLGVWSLGVSWIYVSIHMYGHLIPLLSVFVTCVFISYLALFTGLVAAVYRLLIISLPKPHALFSCLLFSALWCLGEWLRANFLTGFPWLLSGFGQIDTPLKYLFPLIGVYGVGFIACLAATFLAKGTQAKRIHYPWLIAFVAVLLLPASLKHIQTPMLNQKPLSAAVIQANISMRDKWDESLFWKLLNNYEAHLQELIGKKQLIVMPESSIPLPASYISDFLERLNLQAKTAGSAILFGIPHTLHGASYYNSISTLGVADGFYIKQHLVPFGEFVPRPFQHLFRTLGIPVDDMKSGKKAQPLIIAHKHPVASLICYELAYPELLRKQLPEAEWIVSVSDDGWFGHSLAMYQHLQMAQVLSLQAQRYQILANNDGLSSVINAQGEIESSLPPFQAGVLEAQIYPNTSKSLWVYLGDMPILIMCILVVFFAVFNLIRNRYDPF